jgi:dienelactone hydrolase
MKSLFNYKLPIALLAMTALATAANAERYRDSTFKVVKTKDVVYAEDVPALSSPHNLSTIAASFGNQIYFYADESKTAFTNLKMDIYSPKDDKENKRAAVIVAHGGSFVAGAKDDTDQKSVAYCDSLAARGFVAASIQYRLGVTVQDVQENFEDAVNLPDDVSSLVKGLISDKKYEMKIGKEDYARTVYRGVQDINAAVRYLRANATEYGIDPERIYVLGNSAGAILAIENIYTNNKDDFPDYIERFGVPNLGGLNDYGVGKTLDAHANGAVALWGATHNPKTLRYNKTPIFLAHGKADETVYFGTGHPLSNYSVSSMIPDDIDFAALIDSYMQIPGMGAYLAPQLQAKLQTNIMLNIDAPVLYGSYVIDSALTANNGSKKKPETYFVEGAKHEFYNKDAYTATTQTKVFEFLYNLATSDKVVHELAGVTIAKANVNEDSVYAVIDGGYDGKDTLNITKEIEVSSVKFDRTFIENVYSTITLPFSVNTSEIGGLSAVLRYNGIGTDEYGNDAVRMKVMWATDAWVDAHNILDENNDPKQYSHIDLNANYPYLVQMSGSAFSINNKEPITLKKTTVADTTADGWTFHGTWEYKKWESGDTELGVAYGFAASSPKDSKIKVGDFVRIGEGTWITPMRAYLVQAPPKSVRANGSYVKPRQELPEFMSIVIDNEDGKEEHTTVIGQFNTRTGEFKMNYDRGKFDLKGRRVNGTNNARGAYYGRKVLMK